VVSDISFYDEVKGVSETFWSHHTMAAWGKYSCGTAMMAQMEPRKKVEPSMLELSAPGGLSWDWYSFSTNHFFSLQCSWLRFMLIQLQALSWHSCFVIWRWLIPHINVMIYKLWPESIRKWVSKCPSLQIYIEATKSLVGDYC
jgi:hypothetical protein